MHRAGAGGPFGLPARMGEMRYIVIEAGAVGGTIGGRLFESGHEVVLVARGPHLDAALRRFRQVYGMCVWLPATHLEPGTVEAQGAPLAGLLHIGRYPSGTDAIATRIGGDLAGSRFLAPVTAEVMRWKHGKLLSNLGNAIEAVCGHGAADTDPLTVLRRRAPAEGAAVLDAAGIAYASDEESAQVRGDRVGILPVNGSPRAGGSSWQSLTRGTGSIEADFLNGEIVLLGRERGMPTPVNEVLRWLANRAARERRAPGSMTPGEVMALIDA